MGPTNTQKLNSIGFKEQKLVSWAPAQVTFSDYMKAEALPAEAQKLEGPLSFYGLTMEDLEKMIRHMGKEKYRTQQLYKWVYEKGVCDFDQMTNLSKDFRTELKKLFVFELPKVVTHLKSVDGTQKFLFDMGEGQTVEAVLIPSDDRMTLCISSEVGCNMACRFCFTGKQKLKRRLKTHEIVGQFLQSRSLLPQGMKITNIVFMGMGEPLDNPEAVFKTIEILANDWGINFSRRKVTVSTSGIVPEMWRIAASRARLAVSLNGYNNEVRSEVMPINKRWNITELLNECRKYTRETKDLVTFEYVLLKGITDQVEHARELHKLTRDIPCKINIIPFNEHPGSGYARPDDASVTAFQNELMRLGSHVLLRRTMGRDIFAACGQLTSAYNEHPQKMDISNSALGGKHVSNSRRGELGVR
jgi:23S rRNA (adenine2503-C2)-methyltransferase